MKIKVVKRNYLRKFTFELGRRARKENKNTDDIGYYHDWLLSDEIKTIDIDNIEALNRLAIYYDNKICFDTRLAYDLQTDSYILILLDDDCEYTDDEESFNRAVAEKEAYYDQPIAEMREQLMEVNDAYDIAIEAPRAMQVRQG